MRQILDLGKKALQRVNARVAILIVVVAAGGVAVWQGFRYMAAQKVDGPTKQIVTGVPGEASLDPTVRQASATVSDHPTGASPYQLTGYGQDASGSGSAANPYAPSADDPVGGAAGGGYGGGFSEGSSRAGYGGAARPATSLPVDPTTADAGVPDNPYRAAGNGDSLYSPSSDS
ncbi:MAG TPA: hypothetical protein VFV87_13765, partial [Pirellulaceae bacterium]|nr:hypothetical protein [Pirellulaceae bacterium]